MSGADRCRERPSLPDIYAAQAGDAAALARVLSRVDPWIQMLTHRERPRTIEYEDALQEARLAVLTELAAFRAETFTFSTWTALTVERAFQRICRHEKRRKRRVTGARLPLDDLDALAIRDPGVRQALAHNPYPAALNRAFLGECRRRVPPTGLTRLALDLYLTDADLRAESRARALYEESLGQRVRAWIKTVRYQLGIGPRPYARYSAAKQARRRRQAQGDSP